MLTYTTLGYLQQLQRDYVKGNNDKVHYARKQLCKNISQPEKDGDKLFPMGVIQHMAVQQKRKAFAIIQENCNRYTIDKAITEVIEFVRYVGYETYDAKKRDRVLKQKGMMKAYIENLRRDQEINIVHTVCM